MDEAQWIVFDASHVARVFGSETPAECTRVLKQLLREVRLANGPSFIAATAHVFYMRARLFGLAPGPVLAAACTLLAYKTDDHETRSMCRLDVARLVAAPVLEAAAATPADVLAAEDACLRAFSFYVSASLPHGHLGAKVVPPELRQLVWSLANDAVMNTYAPLLYDARTLAEAIVALATALTSDAPDPHGASQSCYYYLQHAFLA